ncbi:LysR family transcriptional regulator [Janibacter corallicola]|uniref:LysR family transcriptional regulator n=1 Tax=Janibacter corallicola TaxID=415212 RepID=UPI000AA8055B|nr:LysR family transcriptional regulator [Janibacter corallicola]
MARWPDLATLELLVQVAELGSMGAAAERLGMTQPAASRTLARFERRCGLTLLERSPRGSRLTSHGALMVDWSREVLAAAERMSLSAAALRRERSAQLRIAASMTVAEYLVPAWLATFRRVHPDVGLDLAVLNSDDVVAGVAAGRHDLGLVETTRLPNRVHSMVIGRDELWVVVPPQHAWARRSRRVTLAELARTPLALRESGSGTRRVLEDALAEHGLAAADPAAELSSNAAVRIAAAAGAGPAVLSEHAVRPSVASGELVAVTLAEGPLQRELRAVWIGGARPIGPAGDLVTTILR